MQNKPDIGDVATAVPHVRFLAEIGEGGFKIGNRSRVSEKKLKKTPL